MRVTIEISRPARRSIALLLGALLLLAPGVVLANHQFPDVPTSNPFHDQISQIAKAGITAGFADGGYHPGEAVTRQAMAAFLHRGFGRVALASGTAPLTANIVAAAASGQAAAVPVRQLTITVPGASNSFSPNQLVYVQGRVTFYTSMSNTVKGCPCEFGVTIRDVATGAVSVTQGQTVEGTSGEPTKYSFDVEALFAAPAGARTYELRVGLTYRADSATSATFVLDSSSSLSAMTFPFGPTGGNTP